MSKVDTLLKKATVYERLALYADRSTFLQSLAQTPHSGQGFGDAAVNQYLNLDEFGNPKHTGIPAPSAPPPEVDPDAGPRIRIERSLQRPIAVIPAETQNQLNDILGRLMTDKKIPVAALLVPDGKLGPETKQALMTYKGYYGTAAGNNLPQMIDSIRTLHEVMERAEQDVSKQQTVL